MVIHGNCYMDYYYIIEIIWMWVKTLYPQWTSRLMVIPYTTWLVGFDPYPYNHHRIPIELPQRSSRRQSKVARGEVRRHLGGLGVRKASRTEGVPAMGMAIKMPWGHEEMLWKCYENAMKTWKMEWKWNENETGMNIEWNDAMKSMKSINLTQNHFKNCDKWCHKWCRKYKGCD